jgi:tRNA threonylcarbamoyladenosine biosynthesis protein TsaE
VGRCLGDALQPGDLVALQGELGSGKTVLVQGIAEALGARQPVHSPTFVLHHRYEGRVPLDHYDLYRLEGSAWLETGLDEQDPEAITVVEWSERATPLREWATVLITLDNDGTQGRILTCRRGRDAVQRCFGVKTAGA